MLRLSYTLLFAAIALWTMLGVLPSYLAETGELTPFSTSATFFHETLQGHRFMGLLTYAALFLQSSLSLPWLGSLLTVGLLVAVAYATHWAVRLPDACFGLCWIVPFYLLSSYTRAGYAIYLSKTPHLLFLSIVSLLPALLLVGLITHRIRFSPLTSHPSPLTSHPSPLTSHLSLLTSHPSPLTSHLSLLTSFVLFVAMGGYFWKMTYRDENFLSIVQMKQAAERNDWERILTLAQENKNVPTRLQVCLTRLALYKTGQMGNRLFTYRDGDAAYNTPRQQQWLRLIAAPLLYYHYGKPGFSYRWAMEDLVEYGQRPASLRMLYRVARLNGEEALARKYAEALRHTIFPHKEEEALLEQETRDIRPLLRYTDQLDGDDGLTEFYLLQSYALMEGGSREMVELSLMDNLITKQLDGFWPRFMSLLPTWQEQVPRHYQEAALMIAQLQGGADTSQLPISDEVRQQFSRLVEASAQLGDNAGNAYHLRPEFGDTYWYYYFFVEGLKTN